MELLLALSALFLALVGWIYLKFRERRQVGKRAEKPAKKSKEVASVQTLKPALLLELAATMLKAGQSLAGMTYELSSLSKDSTSQDLLLEVSRGLSHGLNWQDAWSRAESIANSALPPSLKALRNCLESLADQGAPTADLLMITAESNRRFEARQAEKRAAQLSVKLVLPLGLCSLPAFICWGVVPIMIAMLPGLLSDLK